MSSIKVVRKNELAYRGIEYKMILDGKATVKIKPGECSILPVEIGKHRLQIKLGMFFKSNTVEFSIADNQILNFEVGAFGNGFTKAFVEIKQVQ